MMQLSDIRYKLLLCFIDNMNIWCDGGKMVWLGVICYVLLLLFIDDMMIEINGENGRMVSVNRGNTIYELQYFDYVRVIQVNEYVNINGVIGVQLS